MESMVSSRMPSDSKKGGLTGSRGRRSLCVHNADSKRTVRVSHQGLGLVLIFSLPVETGLRAGFGRELRVRGLSSSCRDRLDAGK
jgi:hypothetical protein